LGGAQEAATRVAAIDKNSAAGPLPGKQILIMTLLAAVLFLGGFIPGPLEKDVFLLVGITVARLAADKKIKEQLSANSILRLWSPIW
jgi:hypothetical protein